MLQHSSDVYSCFKSHVLIWRNVLGLQTQNLLSFDLAVIFIQIYSTEEAKFNNQNSLITYEARNARNSCVLPKEGIQQNVAAGFVATVNKKLPDKGYPQSTCTYLQT